MSESCPILPATADESAARLAAGITVLAALAGLLLAQAWIFLLMAADFALRHRGWSGASPVARAARWLASALGLTQKPVNAGPKRFAALVGMVFTLAAGLALGLGQEALAWILGGTLAACAALEAGLGLCVGCKAYTLLRLGS